MIVWDDSIRQGTKNGKQNTQKELVQKDMTVKQLITLFFKQLEVWILHYQDVFLDAPHAVNGLYPTSR